MAFKDRLGDRRSKLRFEIIGQLWGSLKTVERIPLRNLGRGGALIESPLPLGSDTLRGVRLVIGDQADDVEVRVCHVTAVRQNGTDRYLIGLEFVNPGLATLERIDGVVAAALGRQTIPEA